MRDTIITDAPNIMGGTDGTRIMTAQDGWVWLFGTVEPWNAEGVGWHVSKSGNRFEALQPVAMGLEANVPEVFNTFKEIGAAPEKLFEMMRLDLREKVGHALNLKIVVFVK